MLWVLGLVFSLCGPLIWLEFAAMYPRSGGKKVYLEVVYRQAPTEAPLDCNLCCLCYLSQNFVSQFWSRLDTYCKGMKDNIRQFHIILQWEQLDPSGVPFTLSGSVAILQSSAHQRTRA